MSYTALYRKFRPRTFDDVKGQDHIVAALSNQIKNGKMSHAYLFCGTRGTGKTSIAKIFAKAVNCENPIEGNPCGECPTCRSIAEGSSMNVIEMDAASNNGVDDVRQIVDEVAYSPASGKFKVYIIDEAHMLSPAASNALLKTLEEPPSYVIFILATTEANRLPITILSRCQRYDFRRISIKTISERIRELTQKEDIEIEERAMEYIAKTADGSMRDALSLLDQCAAFYFGQEITYEKALQVLGAVDTKVFSDILRAVIDGNVPEVMRSIEEVVLQGRDLGQFVTDMTWYLRNLLLLRVSDANEDVIDVSADNMALLKEEASLVDDEVIIRYIRVLSELSNRMRFSTQKRIALEVAFIKLCVPAMEKDDDSLIDRIRVLEDKVENGIKVSYAPEPAAGPAPAMETVSPDKQEIKKQIVKALPEDIKEAVNMWPKILSECDEVLGQYLRGSYPSVGDNDTLLVVLRDYFSYARCSDPEHAGEISALIASVTGKDMNVKVVFKGDGNTSDDIYPNLRDVVDEKIDFDIDEIDDVDDSDEDEIDSDYLIEERD
ncbi:MAG: DNA polymerase III subunit gamma/tau [Lachnospiraceae bacterium]|nr:DNA polymerase III subunit gamma/tau [Lachnospiraceae bacterium]